MNRISSGTILLTAALLALLSVQAARADYLLDDFDDGVLNDYEDGWVWRGGNTVATGLPLGTSADDGQALGSRSAPITFPFNLCLVFLSNKPLLPTVPLWGGAAAQCDGNVILATNTGACADNTPSQFIGLWGVRDPNAAGSPAAFDMTSFTRVRFTAYRQTPPAAPAETQFILQLSQELEAGKTYPRISVGPWSQDGSTLTGVDISTTPTVFVVDFTSPATFKADPVYDALDANDSPGGVQDYSKIRAINLGYRRASALAASANLDVDFVVDDILFLQSAPGVTVSKSSLSAMENVTTDTFTVVLDAMPSHPVTVTFVPSATGQITVTPTSWTFIPSGVAGAGESLWNTAATLAVGAPEDFTVEGPQAYSLSLAFTTADLFPYAAAPLDVLVVDDNTRVEDWNRLEPAR